MNLPEFFGLDIGNHSIKAAQVRWSGNKPVLQHIGVINTPVGVSQLEDENAQQNIADKIKELKEAAGIKVNKVVAALPEPVVFSRIVEIPKTDDAKIEETIYWEAKQYIPIAVEDVQLDWIEIQEKEKDGNKIVQVLLVAAPKNIVQQYQSVTEKAGLELIALETESVATARVITNQQSYDKPVLVLDFGSGGTDMSVIKDDSLIFAQTLGTGSDALTKAIANDYGISEDQAEQYKRAYGLLSDQGEGKIAATLAPVMDIIVNEINKTINYFKAHLQEGTPQQIFIVGDGSKLPGLSEFLADKIGIPTQVFGVSTNLEIDKPIVKELEQTSIIGYTVSIGLSMKKE